MKPFICKQFTIHQHKTAMKVGTDAVLLGSWCAIPAYTNSILDIGAGTGIIALMLAQRSSALTIDAVEIDENAYQQTVENFEQSMWADRLFCYHTTFKDFAKQISEEQEKYHLIVSNPPFYTDTFTTTNTARNKARFTSSLPFEELILGVSKILSKEGTFAVILPKKEETDFINLAQEYHLHINKICSVKGTPTSKIKRSLLAFSFYKRDVLQEELVIETARHQYTQEYINLTKDFYLKM